MLGWFWNSFAKIQFSVCYMTVMAAKRCLSRNTMYYIFCLHMRFCISIRGFATRMRYINLLLTLTLTLTYGWQISTVHNYYGVYYKL